jgi:hypothetical protein
MPTLDREKRLRILAALLEGNSERAIERMTGVQQKTIGRLALAFGMGAQRLHDRLSRDLACHLIQVDEIWSYVGKKQARVTADDPADVGEAYTFVALDANSRFVISWHVGKRTEESAKAFMTDVRARLVVMPAMTSDGFAPYVTAIGASFGPGVDFAQVVKNYSAGKGRRDDHRYEPPRDPFITKRVVFGAPNLDTASTAYVERQNATMRHHIGRMRRLCYAFSKKGENHRAAVALSYAWYNLGLVVKTLRVTPAMAAGVASHVWSLEEFMDAILTAAPGAPPERKPLAPRVPEGPARELPNGRGFLRVVPGGKVPGATTPAAPPPAPAPAPVTAPCKATAPAPADDVSGQLDLFAWRPRPRQLSLFNEPDDPVE